MCEECNCKTETVNLETVYGFAKMISGLKRCVRVECAHVQAIASDDGLLIQVSGRRARDNRQVATAVMFSWRQLVNGGDADVVQQVINKTREVFHTPASVKGAGSE